MAWLTLVNLGFQEQGKAKPRLVWQMRSFTVQSAGHAWDCQEAVAN
jgi:hypothetical protein